MAKTLSNNGIVLNQIIYPQQVSQSIDALTGADNYDITISGSFTVTGSTSIDGNVTVDGAITMEGNVVAPNLTDTAQSNVVTYNSINGQFYYTSSNAISPATASNSVSASYAATASYVQNAQTASYVATASWAFNAVTASYVQNAQTASYVLNAVSASYATTASYVANAQTASYVTLAQTASYVNQAVSASYATTASYAVSSSAADSAISASYSTTASFAQNATSASYAASASHADSSNTASYALTASYLEGYISPFPYTGSAQITGSLGVTGSATVNGDLVVNGTASFNVFHTIYNSSSIIYASGSTKFGDTSDDTHQFTGSLYVSGSVTADTFTGTASYATQAATASFVTLAQTASFVTLAQTASYVNQAVSASYAATASFVANAQTASYVTLAQTASYVATASYSNNSLSSSYALTASHVTGIVAAFPYTGSAQITGSLGVTGSVDIYKSGSTVLSVNGSTGALITVTDSISGPLLTVATGSTNILVVDSSLVTTITGSLNVQNGVTASLFGTASWAQNTTTASFVTLAQTASYVLNAVSASFASTASYVNQLNQTVNISGSLNATGSVNIYKSGSSPLVVSGSQGPLFEITDSVSGSLWTIYTGSLPIFDVSSDRTMTLSGSATITGSLTVQNGITGSLFGTASWAQNATTASFVTLAQTASYVLNAVSASFASTASFVNQLNQTVRISGSLFATGSVDIYKSGSTVFAVSGSNGPLFDVTDVVSGSLFTVWTGSTPILQVNSGLTTTITGSLDVQNGITGSLFGTASWAQNAVTASYALSALSSSYAGTASLSDRTLQTDILAINQTGFTIEKGMVVRITGSNTSSDIPRITTASYETDGVSANTLGIATQQITNGSQGFVITEGVLLGIDTTNYISGQLLYLGASGAITGSAPQAPLHTVRLGQVVRQQSNNGSIHVRVDNGYELGELHDTHDTTTTASYGDLLVKSGSLWTNSKQLTGSYGLTGSLTATSFTGSLEGTASYATQALSASFASTASFVNSLVQKVNLTGSLHITSSLAQTSSSIQITLPSGSSRQDYSVPVTKYKQFSYLTTTRPVYQDDYINLGYDSSGNDFEMDINTDPASGRVQVHAFCTTATSVTATSDLIVASVTTDIYPNGINTDSRLEITVHAGLDPNYPFYKITAYRSNTTYGGNISVLVERFFPNN